MISVNQQSIGKNSDEHWQHQQTSTSIKQGPKKCQCHIEPSSLHGRPEWTNIFQSSTIIQEWQKNECWLCWVHESMNVNASGVFCHQFKSVDSLCLLWSEPRCLASCPTPSYSGSASTSFATHTEGGMKVAARPGWILNWNGEWVSDWHWLTTWMK